MPEFIDVNGVPVQVPIEIETAPGRDAIQKFCDDQVKPASGEARVASPARRPSAASTTAPAGTE